MSFDQVPRMASFRAQVLCRVWLCKMVYSVPNPIKSPQSSVSLILDVRDAGLICSGLIPMVFLLPTDFALRAGVNIVRRTGFEIYVVYPH